jgi:hypothetical protein
MIIYLICKKERNGTDCHRFELTSQFCTSTVLEELTLCTVCGKETIKQD